MMRALDSRLVLAGTCLLLLAVTVGLQAAPCTTDAVPAATLLFPYVIVDLDTCANTDRRESVLSIVNTRSEATLVQVTLWTDWSVPTLSFNVYLTGYDTETIRLGDIICDGNLPVTGSAVSNLGSISSGPAAFPGCNATTTPGDAPVYANPFLQLLIDQLQTWLTGQPGAGTFDCAGTDHGDNIARAYATVDVVRECDFYFPDEPAYAELIGFENVLIGDAREVDPAGNQALTLPAVHIEALPESAFPTGARTFYGRYLGSSTIDRREPLPSTFHVRFSSGPGSAFDQTTVRAWRAVPFTRATLCGSKPAWQPLAQPTTVLFDTEENPVAPGLGATIATDRIDMSGIAGNPYDAGWAILQLAHDAVTTFGDEQAQAWATVVEEHAGGTAYAGGYHAQGLDSLCDSAMAPLTWTPPPPLTKPSPPPPPTSPAKVSQDPAHTGAVQR